MEIDESVLIDYLNGRLNKTQQAEVEKWYAQSAYNQKLLEQIYFISFVSDRLNAVKDVDVEKSLKDLKQRLAIRKSVASGHRFHLALRSACRYAAVFAMGLMVTFAIMKFAPSGKALCEVYAEAGSISNVVLPDGSRIKLQPNSKLTYPNNFSDDCREVTLDGEAFFSVAKRNGKKFKVNALGTQIVVKGTKFNLKADSDIDCIEAVLYSGAIDFLASGHKIELKPNQKVVYDRKNNDLHVYDITQDNHCRTFNNENLENVLRIINEIYGSRVVLKNDAVGKIKFTGTIDSNNSLQHSIEVVCISIGAHVKYEGDSVTVYQ